MKKNFLYLIIFFAISCFSVSAKDAIEESIANLQPELLRSILSHGLLMKAEDKAKYLKQIQTLIKDVEQWEKESTRFSSGLKCLVPLREKHKVVAMFHMFWGIAGFAALLHSLGAVAKSGHDHDVALATGALFGSTLSLLWATMCAAIQLSKLSPHRIALSAYRRAYMIKSLLEEVEVVEMSSNNI